MTTGALISEIIKTAFVTLVCSKLLKVMGKKDFGDIIAASGLCICGVDLAKIIVPFCKGVKDFFDKIGKFFGGIDDFFDKCSRDIKKIGDALTFWN